jgi:hypothetical protein
MIDNTSKHGEEKGWKKSRKVTTDLPVLTSEESHHWLTIQDHLDLAIDLLLEMRANLSPTGNTNTC